jgi:creatinine amidohydrolase
VHWEELTGPAFIAAIHQSGGVCLLPFGIIEKHGPHLSVGTDLINVRYVTEKAAQQQYAVVFPACYFGQIAEARQQPETVSYSTHLHLDLLQETTDEMARNGCKKMVIVNGHDGNLSLLLYFAQLQMQSSHDYVVYVYWRPEVNGLDRPYTGGKVDMHAARARPRTQW